MNLNRRTLRKMILREIKMLTEDASLYAHLESARDELIQRKVLTQDCKSMPVKEVIFGIGSSKEAALADSRANYEKGEHQNNPRMGGFMDSDPEVNHQVNAGGSMAHVVVNGSCLVFVQDDIDDF